jgi:RimJ/RimL family protein N-acetyltransferase
MTHPIWPLFDLRVTTPRLEMRYIDDQLAVDLAQLAARGVHDPSLMPFAMPWTDVEPPQLQRNTMQWYWRCRAEVSPARWHIEFAVLVDGIVNGSTSLGADDFHTLRQFETGSWLGREFQGRGIGKEMRQAALHLGFAGLGAHFATTGAFDDNIASLRVTRSLGYREEGRHRSLRRNAVAETIRYRMPCDDWAERLRRDDIAVSGLDPCLPLLGL